MDGIHDMGGMQGFGAVAAEPGEPAFQERWEGRVFGAIRIWDSSAEAGQPWDAFRDRLKAAIADQADRPHYDGWMVAWSS